MSLAEDSLKPSEWLCDETTKTMRLGTHDKDDPHWSSVDAPLSVVKAATVILAGDPSTWQVCDIGDFKNRDFSQEAGSARKISVVVLTDAILGHSFICAVFSDRWVRLNEPQGVAAISNLLQTRLNLPRDFLDPEKLDDYLEDVAVLYKGLQREVLSSRFLRQNSSPAKIKVWIFGNEKRAEALRILCFDPIVRRNGNAVKIQCNILTGDGAIERWIVDGVLNEGTSEGVATSTYKITQIIVTTVREPGTFSWGRVG